MIRVTRLHSTSLRLCFTGWLALAHLGAQNIGARIEGTVVAGSPFAKSKVVVYLDAGEDNGGTQEIRRQVSHMEMRERRFFPDTLVIPRGAELTFENLDSVFHNVFSLSRAASFDLGNVSPNTPTAPQSVVFREPGITFVNCRFHPNMTAAIVVAPTPWTAVADADGHFAIDGVPPGTYTLVAWHRTAGYFRQQVRVTESAIARVAVVIPGVSAVLASTGAHTACSKRTVGM